MQFCQPFQVGSGDPAIGAPCLAGDGPILMGQMATERLVTSSAGETFEVYHDDCAENAGLYRQPSLTAV